MPLKSIKQAQKLSYFKTKYPADKTKNEKSQYQNGIKIRIFTFNCKLYLQFTNGIKKINRSHSSGAGHQKRDLCIKR